MARRASVRYYGSRQAYFTHYQGKQIKLAEGPDDAPNGPTYLAALTAFSGLMEIGNAATVGQGNLVRTVFDLYAQNLEKKGQARTLKIFLQIARHAADAFGDMRLGDLKPFHVQQFLDKMALPRIDSYKRTQKWSPSYQAFAMRSLKAAMNWAKKQQIIANHCLGAVPVESNGSRGEEAYVKRDVFDRIIGATNQNFRDLLRLMWETGCRPDEAYHVEGRYYHKADKCIVYPGKPKEGDYCWKNAKKNRKRVDRLIYLTDELAEMVETRIAKHPKGPIFLTKQKTPWTREAVSVALRWYAKKLKITTAPTAYGLRHTYAGAFPFLRGHPA